MAEQRQQEETCIEEQGDEQDMITILGRTLRHYFPFFFEMA